MNSIPPKIQNHINMLQQIQQQLQNILHQKNQYEIAAKETRRATEEIEPVNEDTVIFMSVGTIMVQKKRDDVIKDLSDKAETLDLRIKSLEKQEKALQSRFEQLQGQIKLALEGKPPAE